jgi:hypothetical protein
MRRPIRCDVVAQGPRGPVHRFNGTARIWGDSGWESGKDLLRRWLDRHEVVEEPRDGMAQLQASVAEVQRRPTVDGPPELRLTKLVTQVDGYSLEAGRHVHEHDRAGLERLVRYMPGSPGDEPPLLSGGREDRHSIQIAALRRFLGSSTVADGIAPKVGRSRSSASFPLDLGSWSLRRGKPAPREDRSAFSRSLEQGPHGDVRGRNGFRTGSGSVTSVS